MEAKLETFHKPPQLKHAKEGNSLLSVFYMCIHVMMCTLQVLKSDPVLPWMGLQGAVLEHMPVPLASSKLLS